MNEPGERGPDWLEFGAFGCILAILGLMAVAGWSVGSVEAMESGAALSERDLVAQQTMAFWTGWMAFASIIGVGIGGFGLFYLARTYGQAKLATEAANRTANEARRIGEAQVRAYISYSNASCTLHGDYASLELSFSVENSGASPAQDVSISNGEAILFSAPEGLGVVFDYLATSEESLRFGDVPAGESLLCEIMCRTTHEDSAAIGKMLQEFGRAKLLFWGQVTFIDVFNTVHIEDVHASGTVDDHLLPTAIGMRRTSLGSR